MHAIQQFNYQKLLVIPRTTASELTEFVRLRDFTRSYNYCSVILAISMHATARTYSTIQFTANLDHTHVMHMGTDKISQAISDTLHKAQLAQDSALTSGSNRLSRLQSSCSSFCRGVPVSSSRLEVVNLSRSCASLLCRSFMRCASSMMTYFHSICNQKAA